MPLSWDTVSLSVSPSAGSVRNGFSTVSYTHLMSVSDIVAIWQESGDLGKTNTVTVMTGYLTVLSDCNEMCIRDRRKWRLKASPTQSANILASRPEKTASAILQAGVRARN